MLFLYKLCFYKVYNFYRKRGDTQPQIYGWTVTSLLLALHVLLVNWIVNLFIFPNHFLSVQLLIAAFLLILLVNYLLIFSGSRYLLYIKQVEKTHTRKHDYYLMLYIGAFILLSFLLADHNRSRIINLKEKPAPYFMKDEIPS